ncbi:unnamed protein product [Tilletia controversa]|nr:unnamed protein product [Tilletia controversa]
MDGGNNANYILRSWCETLSMNHRPGLPRFLLSCKRTLRDFGRILKSFNLVNLRPHVDGPRLDPPLSLPVRLYSHRDLVQKKARLHLSVLAARMQPPISCSAQNPSHVCPCPPLTLPLASPPDNATTTLSNVETPRRHRQSSTLNTTAGISSLSFIGPNQKISAYSTPTK